MAFLQILKSIYSFAQRFRFRKKVGIAFIGNDKSNSAESFCKMGCGEEDFFQKVVFPAKPFVNSFSHPFSRKARCFSAPLVTPWLALFGAVSDGQQWTATDNRRPLRISRCWSMGLWLANSQAALIFLPAEGILHTI